MLSNSSNPIFRPPGTVVAGGGENDLARNGIEITVWPCEGSTRQFFEWNVNGRHHIKVTGHDWLGKPTTSCLGRHADKDLISVRLVDCQPGYGASDLPGTFDLVQLPEGDFHIVITNHPHQGRPCLVIKESANNGGAYGRLGGAPVTTGKCEGRAARWNLNQETGVASSVYFSDKKGQNDVCMTTGWPFLMMGAFVTAEESKTVVLLNEAKQPANYELQDENGLAMSSSIPARAIQTITLG